MYEIIIIIVFIARRLVKDHEDGREIPFQRGNQADTGIDPKGGRQTRQRQPSRQVPSEVDVYRKSTTATGSRPIAGQLICHHHHSRGLQ